MLRSVGQVRTLATCMRSLPAQGHSVKDLPGSPLSIELDALIPERGCARLLGKHVTVNAGGQAIVGSVQPPGGGAPSQTEERPHALTIAPGATMRSANPQRELVPSAGDAQRPLPATRQIDRAAER
jgi:hypothetical protein